MNAAPHESRIKVSPIAIPLGLGRSNSQFRARVHLGVRALCKACAEYGLKGHLVSLEETVDNLMNCSDLFMISVISGPASSVCRDSTLPMVPVTVTGPAPVTVEPNMPCTSSAMLGSFPMAFWAAKVTVSVEANRIANLVIDEAPCGRSGDNLLFSVPNSPDGSLGERRIAENAPRWPDVNRSYAILV